jgi:hypothetical protein
VTKNWPNDCRVGCKSPSNLLEHIGIDGDLEEELKQFERVFERDEIVDLKITDYIFEVHYFVQKRFKKISKKNIENFEIQLVRTKLL